MVKASRRGISRRRCSCDAYPGEQVRVRARVRACVLAAAADTHKMFLVDHAQLNHDESAPS